MYKLLHKHQGANPYNVLFTSGVLILLSLVITWLAELIANTLLLQY